MDFKNNAIMYLFFIIILYNIIHILGKQFLHKTYINGQPNTKTYSIMVYLTIFISIILSNLLENNIFIPTIKINKYIKIFIVICYMLLCVYLYTIYLKKTNNLIYITDKKWYNPYQYKYNIETVITQFILILHFIFIIYIAF